MEAVIELMANRTTRPKIATNLVPPNTVAAGFSASPGFRLIDEFEDNEPLVRPRLDIPHTLIETRGESSK